MLINRFGCSISPSSNEPFSGLLRAAGEPDETKTGFHEVIRSAAPENDPFWLPSPPSRKKVPQMERPGNHEFLKLGRNSSEFVSVRNRTKCATASAAPIIGWFDGVSGKWFEITEKR